MFQPPAVAAIGFARLDLGARGSIRAAHALLVRRHERARAMSTSLSYASGAPSAHSTKCPPCARGRYVSATC
jgi:hypothetical protein